MTVTQVLATVGAIRPNELDAQVLTDLLWELEEQLAFEIRGERNYPRAVTSKALSIPAPFDRIYWTYLASVVDLALHDTEGYRLTSALYRESKEAYARWYQRTAGKE